MNKNYLCANGEVLVIDENGNHTIRDNVDNIDAILVKENVVEKLEKEKKELEYLLKRDEVPEKYNFKYLKTFIAAGLLSFVFGSFMTWFDSSAFFNSLLAFGFCYTLIGLLIYSEDYGNYNRLVKTNNGRLKKLDFIEKKLDKEKSLLEQLTKECSQVTNVENSTVNKVNDNEEMKKLSELLKIYYELGYNEDYFFDLYSEGKLDYLFDGFYDKDDVEDIKKFILSKKNN